MGAAGPGVPAARGRRSLPCVRASGSPPCGLKAAGAPRAPPGPTAPILHFKTSRNLQKKPCCGLLPQQDLNSAYYLAYSTVRVSRTTLTLICPGYTISSSIRLAISLAKSTEASSDTWSGFTIMRISLPACMAKHFSTPENEFAISSSFSRRFISVSYTHLTLPTKA